MLSTILSIAALAAPTEYTGVERQTSDGPVLAIRAARVHVGDGEVLENALVVVSDGHIKTVSAGANVPDGATLLEHDGDLSAGLIALRDYSGASGENRDMTRAVMETAEVAWAYDSEHSDMQRLLAEGITTVVLAPRSGGNLVGGLTAAVKPGGRVLARRVQLHVDMGSSGLSFNRAPTSYAGALAELEGRFVDPADGPFADAVAGTLPVLIETGSRAETRRAIQFAQSHRLQGALVGASRAGELAPEIKTAGLAVVLDTFRVGADARDLASAAQLVEAGVPIAFALDAPSVSPANLRLSAAAAMRAGLDAKAALAALTAGAAEIAGLAEHIGAVRAGLDADLVLWSGPPADPASRVVQVFVDGESVHRADDEEDSFDRRRREGKEKSKSDKKMKRVGNGH